MISNFNKDSSSSECKLSTIVQRTGREAKDRRSKTSRGR